jgi:hypothetical protein
MSSTYNLLRQTLAMPIALAFSSAGTRIVLPGPELIGVFGVDIPVFSAIFGITGVLAGHWLAPAAPAPLDWRKTTLLLATLSLVTVAIVVATGQRPVVAIGWGIGLGFSGVSSVQLLGSQAGGGIKTITDAFFNMIAARISGKSKEDDSATK